MNFTNLTRKIGGISFAFALLTGVLMLNGTSAQAQWRNDDDRWERQRERAERREERRERREERREDRWENRNNNLYRVAQQQGYNDGLREGAEDGRDRDRYNPYNSREYRRATNGWNGRYGNQSTYTQVYRNAFLQGYREGYYRYNRSNNRNYPY